MAHIKAVESFFNSRWNHNLVGTPEQKGLKAMASERMRKMIKDDELYKKMTPDFPVNCRRYDNDYFTLLI